VHHSSVSRNQPRYPGAILAAAAITASALFVIQYTLAGSDVVTLRYILAALITGGAALIAGRAAGERALVHPPDPASLVLAGLAALSIWPVAWWLMDLTNTLLEDAVGRLPLPQPVINLPDSLLGLDLQPAAYEIGVVFAVVLIPLAGAWLWWGLALPELVRLLGGRRGIWAAGALAGVFWALSSPQDITPAMPWGLSSLGGYILVGCVAAWSAALARSAWAGFAAQFVFAYASLAWTDDLFHELGRKAHWDLDWLTVNLLGVFVAAVLLQAIRYREAQSPRPGPQTARGPARLALPLAITIAALAIMAALDIDARRNETADPAAASSQPAQQGDEQSQQP